MKKLLVILMLVAMASFLFVGCLPSVTPEEEEVVEEEEEEVVEPTSATPVLIDIQNAAGTSFITVTSTSTLYMNATELGNSILVTGTAPSESLVKIYIDDVVVAAAVAETSTSGLWTVAIAKSGLGADGVKVMTAKVTEVGLAESAASNSVTFTKDTVKPSFTIAATALGTVAGVTGQISSGTVTGTNPITALGASGTTPTVDLVAGTWTIAVLGDSTMASNVTITSSTYSGTITYNIDGGETFTDIIPGVVLTFIAPGAGYGVVVTTTADVTAAAGATAKATITFSEDVSHAGMALGIYNSTAADDPDAYKESNDTGYWVTPTGAAVTAVGTTYTITAYAFQDLAGNIGGTLASPLSASCTVGAASATLLAY